MGDNSLVLAGKKQGGLLEGSEGAGPETSLPLMRIPLGEIFGGVMFLKRSDLFLIITQQPAIPVATGTKTLW